MYNCMWCRLHGSDKSSWESQEERSKTVWQEWGAWARPWGVPEKGSKVDKRKVNQDRSCWLHSQDHPRSRRLWQGKQYAELSTLSVLWLRWSWPRGNLTTSFVRSNPWVRRKSSARIVPMSACWKERFWQWALSAGAAQIHLTNCLSMQVPNQHVGFVPDDWKTFLCDGVCLWRRPLSPHCKGTFVSSIYFILLPFLAFLQGRFKESRAAFYVAELVLALEFLHRKVFANLTTKFTKDQTTSKSGNLQISTELQKAQTHIWPQKYSTKNT